MPLKYTLESDVDDYVKASLNALGLVKLKDYNEKSSMSDYMKESLRDLQRPSQRRISAYRTLLLKNIIYQLLLRINSATISMWHVIKQT